MKFKLFVFVFIVLFMHFFIVGDIRAYAAEEQKTSKSDEVSEPFIGTVDMMTVYTFHPLMQYYNHELGLFLKPFKKESNSYEKLLLLIEERNKEYNAAKGSRLSEYNRLKAEYEDIKSQMSKLESIYVFEGSSLNDKMLQDTAAAKSDSEKKDIASKFRTKTFAAQKKFEKDSEALKTKFADASLASDKIFNALLEVHYLNAEKSQKQLSEINAEIREAIKFAAKKFNVKAIVNVSSPEIRRPEYMDAASTQPVSFMPAKFHDVESINPDYNQILSMLRNFEYRPDKVHNPNNIRNIFMNSTFIPLIEKKNRMAKVDGIITDSFLFGNIDLTHAVIIYLMAKNGISKEKAELMLDFLNSSEPKQPK